MSNAFRGGAFIAVASILTAAYAGDTIHLAGPYNSDGAVDTAANGIATFNAGASYTLGTITVTGDLTSGGVGSYLTEARMRFRNAAYAGQSFDVQVFASGNGWTGTMTGGPTNGGTGGLYNQSITSGSTWTVNFWESYDDSGLDASWSNLTFQFNDLPPAPSVNGRNYGSLSGSTSTSDTYSVSGGSIIWSKFTLANPVSAADFLQVDTTGSTTSAAGVLDTELGIFDSAGVLVATNDDSTGVTSRISFGSTAYGGGSATLAAGDYYIAAGVYNVSYGNGFVVSSNATSQSNNLKINLTYTPVPEPVTVVVLSLGVLATVRRRKKS